MHAKNKADLFIKILLMRIAYQVFLCCVLQLTLTLCKVENFGLEFFKNRYGFNKFVCLLRIARSYGIYIFLTNFLLTISLFGTKVMRPTQYIQSTLLRLSGIFPIQHLQRAETPFGDTEMAFITLLEDVNVCHAVGEKRASVTGALCPAAV